MQSCCGPLQSNTIIPLSLKSLLLIKGICVCVFFYLFNFINCGGFWLPLYVFICIIYVFGQRRCFSLSLSFYALVISSRIDIARVITRSEISSASPGAMWNQNILFCIMPAYIRFSTVLLCFHLVITPSKRKDSLIWDARMLNQKQSLIMLVLIVWACCCWPPILPSWDLASCDEKVMGAKWLCSALIRLWLECSVVRSRFC